MDPTLDTSPLAYMQPQGMPQLPELAQGSPFGGMFGGGSNLQNALMAAVAGFMARRNSGQAQSMMNLMTQKQVLNRQAQLAMLRDNLDFQRQAAMYQYQLQNPNDPLSQHMRLAGMDLHGPAAQAMYGMAANNEANPFTALDVTGPDGGTQRQYVRPPMAPQGPVGKLTPLGAGGPTPPASGGFLGY